MLCACVSARARFQRRSIWFDIEFGAKVLTFIQCEPNGWSKEHANKEKMWCYFEMRTGMAWHGMVWCWMAIGLSCSNFPLNCVLCVLLLLMLMLLLPMRTYLCLSHTSPRLYIYIIKLKCQSNTYLYCKYSVESQRLCEWMTLCIYIFMWLCAIIHHIPRRKRKKREEVILLLLLHWMLVLLLLYSLYLKKSGSFSLSKRNIYYVL